jgi:uncharacterized membrane protein (DUF2068 family)
MNETPFQLALPHHPHNRWLLLIAAYKLLQSLLFAANGVGALNLLHQDAVDMLAQLADHLRFNPESRFVNFILDEASLLNDPLLLRIGATAFCYAGVGIIEGIGLYLEKAWGEYLTLIITASFLPWEIIKVVHRVTWNRSGLLVANILVFLYLLKIVVERGKRIHRSDGTLPDSSQLDNSQPQSSPPDA